LKTDGDLSRTYHFKIQQFLARNCRIAASTSVETSTFPSEEIPALCKRWRFCFEKLGSIKILSLKFDSNITSPVAGQSPTLINRLAPHLVNSLIEVKLLISLSFFEYLRPLYLISLIHLIGKPSVHYLDWAD